MFKFLRMEKNDKKDKKGKALEIQKDTPIIDGENEQTFEDVIQPTKKVQEEVKTEETPEKPAKEENAKTGKTPEPTDEGNKEEETVENTDTAKDGKEVIIQPSGRVNDKKNPEPTTKGKESADTEAGNFVYGNFSVEKKSNALWTATRKDKRVVVNIEKKSEKEFLIIYSAGKKTVESFEQALDELK